ncbi:hypothetical protein SUGI_1175200 [Cryptomeria japonica]|nr:hypothetical protein SUGI_1175200 [Cryptomeria japonica]
MEFAENFNGYPTFAAASAEFSVPVQIEMEIREENFNGGSSSLLVPTFNVISVPVEMDQGQILSAVDPDLEFLLSGIGEQANLSSVEMDKGPPTATRSALPFSKLTIAVNNMIFLNVLILSFIWKWIKCLEWISM